MKKIILIASVLLTISSVSIAQEAAKKQQRAENTSQSGRTPELMAQKNVDEINSTVSLTEEQKPKVYAICLEKSTKIKEIRDANKGQDEAKQQNQNELEALRKEFHNKLKEILTPEQNEKMKAAHLKKKEARLEKTQPAKEEPIK